MALKVELNAVKKTYTKLMKLPVKSLLPALKTVGNYIVPKVNVLL